MQVYLHLKFYIMINTCLFVCVCVGARSPKILIVGEVASASIGKLWTSAFRVLLFATPCLWNSASRSASVFPPVERRRSNLDGLTWPKICMGNPICTIFRSACASEPCKVYPDEKGSEVDLLVPAPYAAWCLCKSQWS